MLPQSVDFPPVVTHDLREAASVICDLADFVTMTGIGLGIYIDKIAVAIKPGETASHACNRYIIQWRKHEDWYERRAGGDRRRFLRDDGQERRSA